MSWFRRTPKKAPPMANPMKDQVEEARREFTQARDVTDQERDVVRDKLREIGSSPDPLAALVKALRGEDISHVRRRTN